MSTQEPVLLDEFELWFAPWDDRPAPVQDRAPPSAEAERRRLRMISNRDSARRSRMRRQRHLEGLRSEADRLGAENRGLVYRLGAFRRCALLYRRDNQRLLSESAALSRRLAEIRRTVLCWRLRQMPLPPAAAAAAVGGGYSPAAELMLALLMV